MLLLLFVCLFVFFLIVFSETSHCVSFEILPSRYSSRENNLDQFALNLCAFIGKAGDNFACTMHVLVPDM